VLARTGEGSRGRRRVLGREQLPRFVDPAQPVRSAIRETDVRPDEKIANRS